MPYNNLTAAEEITAQNHKLKKEKRPKGLQKTTDKALQWVTEKYPLLEAWRKLGSEWLHNLETGRSHDIQAVNHFITYLAETGAPTSPLIVMQFGRKLPDFYQTRWGSNRTKGPIHANNQAHYFLEWVLMRPEYCVVDAGGKFVTLPAFSNPVKLLTVSGIPVASKKRSTITGNVTRKAGVSKEMIRFMHHADNSSQKVYTAPRREECAKEIAQGRSEA